MAWYRCGGGGIPSSLKGDMNDVFNKKFGTVLQDYPPDEWPGTVNLMGPLPEKTVSGSVVAFPDGADAVKLKSCAVTIAPTLDGVSSVDVVHGGKNLVSNSASAWESGTINSSGNNASGSGTRTIGYYEIQENAQFIISGIVAPSTSSDFRIFYYDKNKNFLTYKNYSVTYLTTPANARYFRLRNVSVDDISTLQIEYGDTATTYTQFVAPTTHTATLGRTIYGGDVDVVNGTGTAYGYVSETWGTMQTSSTTPPEGYIIKSFNITSAVADYSKRAQSIAKSGVNSLPLNNTATDASAHYTFQSQGRYIYVCMPENTASDTVISIAYPLAMPEDFTFTPVPINSRLGDNTLWGDGDLSVTYRRDIDLALAQ